MKGSTEQPQYPHRARTAAGTSALSSALVPGPPRGAQGTDGAGSTDAVGRTQVTKGSKHATGMHVQQRSALHMRRSMEASHCFLFFGSDQDEPASPAHFTVLEVTPRNQGSELSSATMIPQMTVVVDLTRSEDWLSLKPGDAVGDCHAHRLPSVHEAQLL